jgi:ligand-binding sensor domain-containing protein
MNMIKYIVYQQLHFLLLLFVFITSCNGQDKQKLSGKPLPLEQRVKADTSQISEYIVEIFEDTKGNLWFGTMSDGAVRFDGKKLTYFSVKDGLCDNTVASIAEDKEGNIWFGTHAGASKYDGKTFTNFTETKGLHGAGCNFLVDRKGNIWAGTNHGVFRYNGSSFSKLDLPNPLIENPSYKWVLGKVWSLIEDRAGNIWFGRDGFGACKFDGNSFTHFTQKDGLCSNTVSTIVEDVLGNIWFGSISYDFPKELNAGGVSRFDGKTFTQYPDIEKLTKNDVYTTYADKKGNVWLCALRHGMYRYNEGKFILFKEIDLNNDITNNFGIQSMLEDSHGTLWCGFSGGLFRFDGTAFRNVTKSGPW